MLKPYTLGSTLLFFLLIISSCGKRTSKKTSLIYEDGEQKIQVEIENGQKFLFYDTPTKTDFILTNIDPYTLIVHGPGIKVLGTKNKSIMKTEINVPINYLEKDTLIINVRFGEGRKKSHDFHIPLRKFK